MGLETGTFVSELVGTNPAAGDNVSQGDDHLRLIKLALQATFPNADQAFYLSEDFTDIASATSTAIGGVASLLVNITGTTTITSFGTIGAGIWRMGKFAGILTLTHNATSLILPGGASITTAAGDTFLAVSRGSGNWTVVHYQKASGRAIVQQFTDPVPVANGGTGQTTAAEAVGEMIQALTEDLVVDRQLDFIGYYDAGEDTGNKLPLYAVAGVAVLASGTLSAQAALDIALDGFTQFKSFKLILRDVVPATDAAIPWVRVSDDGGGTFEADASDYKWVYRIEELATTENNTVTGDGADSEIELSSGVGNASGEFACFEIAFENPKGTSLAKMFRWTGELVSAAPLDFGVVGWGKFIAVDDITDIRFMFSTGNITSGSYTLVGYI